MKRIHPKPVAVIICMALIIPMFGGCRARESEGRNGLEETLESTVVLTQQVTDETSVSSTAISTQDTTGQPEEALFEYSWNPHVFSQIDREAIGTEAELFLYDLIDGVIAGEVSVPCADKNFLWDLDLALGTYFPPFYYIVADSVYADGEVLLTYRLDVEQRDKLLSDFSQQIETLVGYAGLLEEDSQTVRAIKLYRMYSGLINYDYAALDSEIVTDVSSYRGLMELEGICQSFAPAYAYLCLQVGVEATTASGMNTESAHEWTILTLDDKYYYADPTFESGDGGYGLTYFGMTAVKRELAGEFIADEYNIGNSNDVWGKDIDVTDDAFAPLWEAVYVVEITQNDGILVLSCEKADGSFFDYEVM